jgi:transcription elongation factor Elf1
MLEIKLERAFEPEMMREQPCRICGADFQPEAVLAELETVHEYIPVCEVCLHNLARRAEEEAIPADWDKVYRRYIDAVEKYPEPVFPSVKAAEEAEARDPKGTHALMLEAAKV